MAVEAKLQSATKLEPAAVEAIKKHFESIVGDELALETEICPDIIGGFIVVIGDKIYDNSVRAHIDDIKKYIAGKHMFSDINKAGADFKISSEPIKKLIDEYKPESDFGEIGTVKYSGDGIAHVAGLKGCKYGGLLEFENNCFGIVMNLSHGEVGAVLLDNITDVGAGSSVRDTGGVVKVSVGDALKGRIVNPLGMPIDGKGKIIADNYMPIESEAPSIFDRKNVEEPLETGIMFIDSMIPIGKGQRELIIGDRQTGKTAIAIDTILNQHDKNVVCVYVAIGQKASTISSIVNTLESQGALSYTVVVASTSSDAPAMQYIAPYAGCAIAEQFMHAGKDVLVVYDDLSKHAVAYRTMSLLLRRPPGREAYPGDVFYLHSRLLERAACLSSKLGGGSLTALPIIETMAGDISAYIPTNVISITDGQIFLESELFNAGIRPAVNVGLSVSRVGGNAQINAMRKVAGRLRLDLAQYRELAVFARFASELDKTTQETLEQGVRLTEALKQEQYDPLSMVTQVMTLHLATNKHLLRIPKEHVKSFCKKYVEYANTRCLHVREDIEKTGDLSEEHVEILNEAAREFFMMYAKENNIPVKPKEAK